MVEPLIPAVILTLGAGAAIVAFVVHEKHKHEFVQVPNTNSYSTQYQTSEFAPRSESVRTESPRTERTRSVSLPVLSDVSQDLPLEVKQNLNTVHEFLASLIPSVSTSNTAFQQEFSRHKPQDYLDSLSAVTGFFQTRVREVKEDATRSQLAALFRKNDLVQGRTLWNNVIIFSNGLRQLSNDSVSGLTLLINSFNEFCSIAMRIWSELVKASVPPISSQKQEVKETSREESVESAKTEQVIARKQELPEVTYLFADLPDAIVARLVAVRAFLEQVRDAGQAKKIFEVRKLLANDSRKSAVDALRQVYALFLEFLDKFPPEVQIAFRSRLEYNPAYQSIGNHVNVFEDRAQKAKTATDTQTMVAAVGVLIVGYNQLVRSCEGFYTDLRKSKPARQKPTQEAAKKESKVESPPAPAKLRTAVVIRDAIEIPEFPVLIKKQLSAVQLFLRELRTKALTDDLDVYLRGVSFTSNVNALMIARLRWVEEVKAQKGKAQVVLAKANGFGEGTLAEAIDSFKKQSQELARTSDSVFVDGMIAVFNGYVNLSAEIWKGIVEGRATGQEAADKALPAVAEVKAVEPQGARFYFEGLRPKFMELRQAIVDNNQQKLRALVDAKEYALVYAQGLSRFYRGEIARVFDLPAQERLRNLFDIRHEDDIMISAGKNIASCVNSLAVALNTGADLIALAQACIKYFNWTVDFCKKSGVSLVAAIAANPKPVSRTVSTSTTVVSAGPLSFADVDILVKQAAQIVQQMIEAGMQVQMRHASFMSSAGAGSFSASAQAELGAARRAFDISVRRKGELQGLFDKICKQLEALFRAIPDAVASQRMLGLLLWRFAQRAEKDNALDYLAEQVNNAVKRVFKQIEAQKVSDYPKAALDVSGVKDQSRPTVAEPTSVNALMSSFNQRYISIKQSTETSVTAQQPTPRSTVAPINTATTLLDVEELNNMLYVLKDYASESGVPDSIRRSLNLTIVLSHRLVSSFTNDASFASQAQNVYPGLNEFVKELANAASPARIVLQQLESAVVNYESNPQSQSRAGAVKAALSELGNLTPILVFPADITRVRAKVRGMG